MTPSPVVLAADIGGTWIRVAVLDAALQIVHGSRVPVEDRSPKGVLLALTRAVQTLPGSGALPMGIAVAGFVRKKDGRVARAPNLDWTDVPLGDLAAAALSRPVLVVNDLCAAAWGETLAGAAQGFDDVVLVSVGSGVGAGLVSGGRLIEGGGGVAGEFGHVTVDPTGPSCGCGRRGCLEAYAGGHRLVGRARETGADVADVPALVQAAKQDPALAQLLDDAGCHLGIALSNLVTLMNPGCLVLAGSVLHGVPGLRDAVAEAVRSGALPAATRDLHIVDAALGDDAGLIGVAALARKPRGP